MIAVKILQLDEIRRAITPHPRYTEEERDIVYASLAYMAKRKPDLAITHFQKALELKPDYTPARNNLGTAYLDKEDWHAAIDCFETAAKDLMYMTPHFPLTNMGFAYYKLGDYNKAIQYSRDALEISQNFPKAHHNLGLACMADGRHADAIDALERAAALAPQEAQIYFDLGRAYKLDGEYHKSYESFKKAASLTQRRQLAAEAEAEAERVRNLR